MDIIVSPKEDENVEEMCEDRIIRVEEEVVEHLYSGQSEICTTSLCKLVK